jgi:hypothetical protein
MCFGCGERKPAAKKKSPASRKKAPPAPVADPVPPVDEGTVNDDIEDMTLAQLAQAQQKKKAPRPRTADKRQTKAIIPAAKKRKVRPAASYTEDPSADPTNWTFPTDKRNYMNAFVEFMNFLDNKGYTKESTFSKAHLLKIKPKHVLAFLTYKAFGKATRTSEDRPTYGRSNHIKNLKMKISYYMPSSSPWADLPNGKGYGNPTKHKAVNRLINDIIQFEVRGQGADPHDVREMTMAELEKELELFRSSRDETIQYRNPLFTIYQLQFINRTDDIVHFRVGDPKGNDRYPQALSQSVRWSKNIRDMRNCPDQLLLASKDHRFCMFIALAVWLEYFLHRHPDATYLMSAGLPEDNTKEAHKRFVAGISKTFRNQWVRTVVKNEDFGRIYTGTDERDIGLHSKRKTGATQAKNRGAERDHVDHRGRWASKKGSQIVNKTYISPEDLYADAKCATALAIGGPIRYKVKDLMKTVITEEWLSTHVIPNIARRYANDHKLIWNLGLAFLWMALNEEAANDLNIPPATKRRVLDAYAALPLQDKPTNPVEKIPQHMYRVQENTIIEDAMTAGEATRSEDAQQGPDNLGDQLARVPATGGNAANQEILQTIVIQQRNLQLQQQQLMEQLNAQEQRNRAWFESRLRTINENIRRFGGTIHSAVARQDPLRQADVRRARAEGPPVNPYTNQGRVWPRLSNNVRDLMSLWNEWQFGLSGGKPAKDWTGEERGGGGDRKVKQMYHRRRNIWRIQQLLTNKGQSIYAANRTIRRTYGETTSLTAISAAVAKDRATFKHHGGLHPNFR